MLAAAAAAAAAQSPPPSRLCALPPGARADCEGTYVLSDAVDAAGRTPLEECTVLDGDIVVAPPGDTGAVQVRDAPALVAITGSVILRSNNNATAFEGLNALAFVGGDVDIFQNPELASLNALANLRCVGGSLFLERLYKLEDLGSGTFARLHAVANNDPTAQMRVEGTALRSLDNLAALVRVGAPFDGAANTGQTLTVQNNPNLRDLFGLQNLAVLAGDSSLGGLAGSFGECGALSDGLLRSGNVTWGLCQLPTYFVDQGSAGTFATAPQPAGPCAVEGQCPNGLRTTDGPLANNLKAYGTCVYKRKDLFTGEYVSWRCQPTVRTLLEDRLLLGAGDFARVAAARGFADELAAPSSHLWVKAPGDYELWRMGGVAALLADPARADAVVRDALDAAPVWGAVAANGVVSVASYPSS